MKEKIIKGAFILSLAPIITQVFSILILPFITRLYTPNQIGEFESLIAIVGVVSVFHGLGYHQAIILPKKEINARKLFNFGILLTLLISTLFILSLSFIPKNIILKYFSQSILEYKTELFFIVIFEGFYLMLSNYNIRLQNFKAITKSRVFRVFVNKTTVLTTGLILTASVNNFVIASVFGGFTVCLILFLSIKKIDFLNKRNFKNLKKTLYKYKQFPLYNLPNDLLFRLNQALIIYVILNVFGMNEVGIYGMSLLILSIPITLISNSIGEVYYSIASKLNNKKQIGESINDLSISLLSFSLIIFIMIIFYSEKIIPILLSQNWINTGSTIKVLTIYSFSQFMVGPFLNVFKIIQKQKFNLYYQISSIILSTFGVWILSEVFDFNITLLIYSILYFIISTIVLVIIFKSLDIKKYKFYELKKILLNIIPAIILNSIYIFLFSNSLIIFDISIIILSIIIVYYLNYKSIDDFKSLADTIVINRLFKNE